MVRERWERQVLVRFPTGIIARFLCVSIIFLIMYTQYTLSSPWTLTGGSATATASPGVGTHGCPQHIQKNFHSASLFWVLVCICLRLGCVTSTIRMFHLAHPFPSLERNSCVSLFWDLSNFACYTNRSRKRSPLVRSLYHCTGTPSADRCIVNFLKDSQTDFVPIRQTLRTQVSQKHS